MLGVDQHRRILVFYTNVLWDAQIIYKSNIFYDIFDCLTYIINLVKKNPDVLLIIRIHPAEVKSNNPTRTKIFDFLKEFGLHNVKNVRIVQPESNISSYVLADLADVNIVYGTKMALEMAIMKRNVVICGETFSRNKGYGVDVESRDQLNYELLSRTTSPAELSERYERALKYAHYFYFERMIDFPVDSASCSAGSHLSPLLSKDVVDHSGIQKICNTIIDLAPSYAKYNA
jgi:hypothetical protein